MDRNGIASTVRLKLQVNFPIHLQMGRFLCVCGAHGRIWLCG